jgi:hypothetical protein
LLQVGFLSGAALREKNHAMEHLIGVHPAQIVLLCGQRMHEIRDRALGGNDRRQETVGRLSLGMNRTDAQAKDCKKGKRINS